MVRKKLYKMNRLYDPTLKEGISAKNMIKSEGVLRKRNGWRVIGEFKDAAYNPQKINGIYEFKGTNKASLVIHAGDKLYECSYDLNHKWEISLEKGVTLKNQRSCGVMYNGLLWLSGMGELLVYDGVTVKRVYESQMVYVPTTATGITEAQLGIKPQTKEVPNLLTRKRKNTLRGQKTELGFHYFCLDTKAAYGQPFKINACFRVRKENESGNEVTTDYVGINADGEEVNTVVYTEIFVPMLEKGEKQSTPVCYDVNGNAIDVKYINFSWRVIDGRDLVLYFDALSPQLNEDNITVEFVEDVDENRVLDGVYAASAIQGEDGAYTMLLSCGDNKIYYSGADCNYLYFPQSNVIKIGRESEGITAIFPMLNGYIGAFKKHSFYRLKLNDEKNGEYKVYPSSDRRGCVSPYVAKCLEYDCLAFNEDGVFGTTDTDNAEAITTHLYSRFGGLKKELSAYSEKELLDAVATVHKGRYYLFLQGRVYISGDKTGKSVSSKDYEYEWWCFESCPAVSAYSTEKELYMGRKNGDVAVFDSEYTDREEITLRLSSGDFMLKQEDNAVVIFNDSLGILTGDRVRLDTHHVYMGYCTYTPSDLSISLPLEKFFDKDGYVAIYEGMWVKVTNAEGIVLYHGAIKETCPSQSSIYCGDLGYTHQTGVQVYMERGKETEYTLSASGDGFKLSYGGASAILLDLNVEKIFITRERAVECELCTPVTDLDVEGKKTLYGIVLDLSEDTKCTLTAGYETVKNTFERQVSVGECLDFDALDYRDFTFNPKFKQSLKIYCLERHLDFIKLKVKSDQGERLGIEGISLIYSLPEHIKK